MKEELIRSETAKNYQKSQELRKWDSNKGEWIVIPNVNAESVAVGRFGHTVVITNNEKELMKVVPGRQQVYHGQWGTKFTKTVGNPFIDERPYLSTKYADNLWQLKQLKLEDQSMF